MILDDETLLSAYLDGELSAEDRHRVEMALLADPETADQLRQLAAVRDIVDSLSVPVLHADLSQSVMAQLRSQKRPVRILRLPLRRPLMRVLIDFGVAAAIMLSLSATLVTVLRRLPPRPDRLVVVPKQAGPKKIGTIAKIPAGPDSPVTGLEEVAEATPSFVVANRPEKPSQPLIPRSAVEDPEEQDRQFVREMLENPHPNHLFVVDTLGGQASERVGELIREMPRLDAKFGRVMIRKGLVFDPQHPSEATVYAFLADDKELTAFRDRLHDQFPDSHEEGKADPVLLTQLADIPQMAVLSGTLTADLLPHPRETGSGVNALRTETKSRPQPKPVVSEEFENMHVMEVTEPPAGTEEGPTPEQMRSGPHPSTLSSKDGGRPGEPRPEDRSGNSANRSGTSPPKPNARKQPVLVLVWVANPTTGR